MDEVTYLDVSDSPELARVAESVRTQGKPLVLTRGSEELAVLSPVAPTTGAKRRTRRASTGQKADWILGLIGLGSSEGPNDVSANKHQYLADAVYDESHPHTSQ
jgi:hypothetical protein